MELSKNYRLSYDEKNVILQFFEPRIRTKKDGSEEPFEYVHDTYHGTIKNALKAFVQKSIRGSESVEEILARIAEVETKIDLLCEQFSSKEQVA